VAPLEPWEKVLVQGEDFYATVHGQIACGFCHSGVNSADKETAHTGLILDPSSAPNRICDSCHQDTEMTASSLHGTLQGYWTAIEARGGSRPQYDAHRVETLLTMYDQHCGTCHTDCEQCHYSFSGSEEMLVKQDAVDALRAKVNHIAEINAMVASPEEHATQTMFNNHCSSCHASCGDCHISQPSSVGGGFVSGHVISKTPSMSQNCTACHGSRVGNEYLGKHEEIPGDAHFRLERMNCVSCHTGTEMHNSSASCTECHTLAEGVEKIQQLNRYAGAQTPSCESCHPEVGAWNDTNKNHKLHSGKLSCQVCHSVSYTSCDGCHVAISEKTGKPFYQTEGDYLTFFIGKNPLPNYHRPYEYVVLRHVPAAVDSYSYYGENLQPGFDSLPTWIYATPHNVQKNTAQNESCNACHGNADIFLTADKVKPEEVNANQSVIVDQVPDPVEEP
jgi:thiosulfate/3-mercaptopyruvate sulfurtransferase